MTVAVLLGHARDALERAQSYARLAASGQRTVLIPGPDKEAPPEEVSTAAVAIHELLRIRADIDRAIQEMRT